MRHRTPNPALPNSVHAQIQEKMRAKKAAALAEQREARREAGRDDTDRLRQALQGSRKQKGKAAKKGSGSSPSKGFGSK
jgi:non-homologous end joining protein Ku